MNIQVISFDLDETLWPLTGVIEHAEQAVFNYLRSLDPALAPYLNPEHFLTIKKQVFEASQHQGYSIDTMRRMAVTQLLKPFSYSEQEAKNIAEQALTIFLQARHSVIPFADVLPTLVQLSTRYHLIALTNGNANIFRLPLGHFFDGSLQAQTVGHAKPSKHFYQQAISLADVAPDQILHIGDHPRDDVHGAKLAGLRTIWLNRLQQNWPTENDWLEPDFRITNLSQLFNVLAQK